MYKILIKRRNGLYFVANTDGISSMKFASLPEAKAHVNELINGGTSPRNIAIVEQIPFEVTVK